MPPTATCLDTPRHTPDTLPGTDSHPPGHATTYTGHATRHGQPPAWTRHDIHRTRYPARTASRLDTPRHTPDTLTRHRQPPAWTRHDIHRTR
ncbi:unnamed protein product [Caretta caretta]